MSLNTAHLNGGVLIHAGERILLYSEHVNIEFTGPQESAFRGKKEGRIYLTTHRMIFNNKNPRDEMQSFSFPFVTLSDLELEQPVFGANYIKGKVRAQPNGNWIGEAKIKLVFKHGGAIDFGQAMLRAAHFANTQGFSMDAPPPYTAPQGDAHPVPPPAYAPPPQGYYGWVPPYQVFPEQPAANSVYVHDVPPPYPGIVPGYQANGYPPQQQQQQGGGGYPPQQGGYPPQQGGYPPQQGGYPPQYPPQQGGYPPQQGGYPPQQGGYPPPQGAVGGGFRSAADAKAAEAAQSAYYDPNRPQMAYVPPPYYYENPPSYDQATNKKTD